MTAGKLRLKRVKVAAAAGAVVWLTGCGTNDPGWHYETAAGRAVQDDGLRYELNEVYGVRTRIYGDLFAGTLMTELDVLNSENETLVLDMSGLSVADAKGKKLRRRQELPTARCGGESKGRYCVLNHGQSCRVATAFDVEPLARSLLFRRRNPDLSEIVVRLKLKKNISEPELTIPLVWKK